MNAEYSKHKLQTKAKLASLNQQLEQTQKTVADAAERVCSHRVQCESKKVAPLKLFAIFSPRLSIFL